MRRSTVQKNTGKSIDFCCWFVYSFVTVPFLLVIYRDMDLNKVMIIWRSTTDVEIKKIESTGSSVVNFSMATNRKYKNKEGQVVEESEYHRCVAYGNAADIIGQYVTKGKRMYVEWRLRTRKWEDTTWNTRYTTEIVLDNFIFLDSKGAPAAWGDDSAVAPLSDEEDLPF